MAGITDLLTRALPQGGPIQSALGNGPLQGRGGLLSGGPVMRGLSALSGLLGLGDSQGPISGQQQQDDRLNNDISNTANTIWDQPLGGALGQIANQQQGSWGDEVNSGPSAYAMDPYATDMGPFADLAGGSGEGGNVGSAGSATGNFSGVPTDDGTGWNNASGNMIADFSAPVFGDFMARLQSHVGAQGPNASAKEE